MPLESSSLEFTPVCRLGAGGMGEVYLARWDAGGESRWVAQKRIHAALRGDPSLLKHFEREAALSRHLVHPNVVRLLAHGVDRLGPYRALESVFGRSAAALSDALVEKRLPLPLGVALSILCDAADGLEYAHTLVDPSAGIQGVVHRDLSPDNILIGYDGVAKLSDFGLAYVPSDGNVTHSQTLKGKFGFMAPELFDGHPADVLTDVFALGVSAYRLITGVRPFHGRTEAEIMRSVLFTRPVRMGTLRPDVPQPLEQLVHRALEGRREDRLRSAGEFLGVVASLLAEPKAATRRRVGDLLAEHFPPQETQPQVLSEPGGRTQVRPVVARPRRTRWLALAATAVALPALALLAFRVVPSASPEPEAQPRLAGATTSTPSAKPARASTPSPPPAIEPASPASPEAPPASPPPHKRRRPAPLAERPPKPGSPAGPATAGRPEAKLGELHVLVYPWGQLFIDGDKVGTTPVAPVQLPAGAHSVIVVNDELHARRHFTVNVQAGKREELKVRLDAP